ncbi:MAG: FIST C-terminal domain-containing protein [Rhodospirillales bacterium]|nr:FIST C-terminal domain-containing protein [Rhodospirillales bacterium]
MPRRTERGIHIGYSCERDPDRAAAELHCALAQPDAHIAVFFCSANYDLAVLGQALAKLFGEIRLIGCTTAGEIAPVGYLDGCVVGFSLAGPDFAVVSAPMRNLPSFSIAEGKAVASALRKQLDQAVDAGPADNSFAFLLIDGLDKCEDIVVSAINSALGKIPLFGGSSGGAMTFGSSSIYYDGAFHSDSAVLLLVRTRRAFRLFTVDHFVPSETRMVITEADPLSRVVTEINAEPAGREYARLVGLDVDRLTPMIFATHPVMVKVGGRYYVRSIQKVNDDGSLTFFSAIDKGLVLTVARGTDIVRNLAERLAAIRAEIGPPQLLIGCECILRNLELEQKQLKGEAGRLLAAQNAVGFNTFGEQFQAMHVNQTFTGAAIGRGRAGD